MYFKQHKINSQEDFTSGCRVWNQILTFNYHRLAMALATNFGALHDVGVTSKKARVIASPVHKIIGQFVGRLE